MSPEPATPASRIPFSCRYDPSPTKRERRSETRSRLSISRRQRPDHGRKRRRIWNPLDRHADMRSKRDGDRRALRRARRFANLPCHLNGNERRRLARPRQLSTPAIEQARVHSSLARDFRRDRVRLLHRRDQADLIRSRPTLASTRRRDDFDPVHGTVTSLVLATVPTPPAQPRKAALAGCVRSLGAYRVCKGSHLRPFDVSFQSYV